MKSAPPIAPPGCPDLAFSTIDTARIRILSAARFINFAECSMSVLLSISKILYKNTKNSLIDKILAIIIDKFYNFLSLRLFERMDKIEVPNWQSCRFPYFAMNGILFERCAFLVIYGYTESAFIS